ncbi:MAG: hypothetical protein WKF32_05625 [Thermoleophilaceae bacterium]
MRLLLPACVGLAALSLLVVPAAPGYDPWMWLLWGRELAGGSLDTADGPAFKPLPVALCTLLAPLGSAAPAAWLILARAGALAALALAAVLATRLAGRLAGVAAGAGVAFTGSLLALGASGSVEGLFVAVALGGVLAWRSERPGLALACGFACALMRVEAIPFLMVVCAIVWRERPGLRPAMGAGLAALPALWLLPDALSTGELLRSAERARIPNPGQPALADTPFFASLAGALGLAAVPVALGVLFLRLERDRLAIGLAAGALAWVTLVAAMAELGFSGEQRYVLPGVAVLTVAGAVGLGRAASARPWARLALAAAVLVAVVPGISSLSADRERIAHGLLLSDDLDRAVALAGGREAVLACGPPVVGQYRGPLLAYRLAVRKSAVTFSTGEAGVAFASRLTGERTASPALPTRYRVVARAGSWRVAARCAGRRPG